MHFLICFLALCSLICHTQDFNKTKNNKELSGEWQMLFDSYGSSFMGSSILSSVNNALFWSEDKLIKSNNIKINQPWSGFLRISELILIVLPINDFLFLWQHEFFGHGARAREFGFKTSWVKFTSPPLPYGLGTAAISYDASNASKLQSLMVTLGGVEGANILAEDINDSSWRHKKINAKSALMNIIASHNTDGYLWVFSPKNFTIPGHDIVNYINKVNNMYGDNRLTIEYMNWSVITNLLDPFLYFGLYSLYKYVIDGKSNNSYPFINLSENISYLPAIRYVLSPLGPEYHFINYLSIYDHHIKAYGSYGSLSDTHYMQTGLSGDIYHFKNITIGTKINIWQQPKLLASGFSSPHLGAYGAISTTYQPFDVISFKALIGYKSDGYVLGEPIDQKFIWRIGLTWHM